MPKIGDRILIVANTGGHNYAIGRKYTINGQNGGYWQAYDPATGFYGNNLQVNEFKVVKDKVNLKALTEEEKELQSRFNKLKFVSEYLDKNGLEECGETELTASYLLELLESNAPNKKDELVKILNKLNNSVKLDYISYH
jgi:hypothetical protein